MAHSLHTRQEFLFDLIRNGAAMYGYSIHNRQGLFSPVLARRFGAPDTVEDMPNWMIRHGNVAPDSIDAWRGLFDSIDRGESCGTVMVSLKSDDGVFGRYWLRADLILDEKGQPFFALITSDNFTELSRQFHAKDDDIRVLLHATTRMFQEILSINLTKGLYRVIHCDTDAITTLPQTGRLPDMVRIRTGSIYPEDQKIYSAAFSPAHLAAAFLQDRNASVQTAYRRPAKDGTLCWMETTVTRHEDSQSGDVMLLSLSRNVDAQKAEEIRLREQLRQQKEELRLTMMQVGKALSSYDIAARTLILPTNVAERTGMPVAIKNYPEPFIEKVGDRLSLESADIFRKLFQEIHNGSPSGSCDFLLPDKAGRERWLRQEYTTVFDDQNRPVRAVIASSDVTAEYTQALENQRLKENEYLLRLTAQHSDRVVCHYDVKKQSAGVLEPKACARCQLPHLCEMNKQAVLQNKRLPPESVDALREMFQSIEDGQAMGEIRLQATLDSGDLRWFSLKYTTVYDEQGKPASAILSHKDITEEYERELAYQRYVSSIESDTDGHIMYIEGDLTAARIEKLSGKMPDAPEQGVNYAFSDIGQLMRDAEFQFVEKDASARYFAREKLLEWYACGERLLESEWQVHYGDSLHWMNFVITLLEDPYNGHIRAFIRILDITEEKQALLEIQRRSERDSMTGLYNRATAEAKIRSLMAAAEPGILVLIDLDDLKGINDTFGHKEGDKAILGITQTMQTHFRESDVLGRLGGDEFLIYLPGAAENANSISVSLTSMLRKLSGISIGNGERRLRCSMGCALQSPQAATFDALFKQADTALYHVKRCGKNNFAFFEPEMDREDYQFRTQKLLSMQGAKQFDAEELQRLIEITVSFYQMVLSVNLSANDYYLMDESVDVGSMGMPAFGAPDDIIQTMKVFVHPHDADEFCRALSRSSLLAAYARGEKNVRHHFRFNYQGEYRWIESVVIFYTNDQGHVCDFTLLRWADERANELERLWLQKVMELAVSANFEYICLLNLTTGEYSLFGNGENTHGVPNSGDFDTATRGIRDHSIEESKRSEYYENARVATIAACMRENDGNYAYRYTMSDGERQASFHWFEPTYTQVLMTVQRVGEA